MGTITSVNCLVRKLSCLYTHSIALYQFYSNQPISVECPLSSITVALLWLWPAKVILYSLTGFIYIQRMCMHRFRQPLWSTVAHHFDWIPENLQNHRQNLSWLVGSGHRYSGGSSFVSRIANLFFRQPWPKSNSVWTCTSCARGVRWPPRSSRPLSPICCTSDGKIFSPFQLFKLRHIHSFGPYFIEPVIAAINDDGTTSLCGKLTRFFESTFSYILHSRHGLSRRRRIA